MNDMSNSTDEIQRARTGADAKGLIELVAALPIPGVSKVLDPISIIFGFSAPDKLQDVLDEVKHSNFMLENSYQKMMDAFRIHDLETLVDASLRDIKELADDLGHDTRLAGDVPDVYKKSEDLAEDLNDHALDAIEKATRFLVGFEGSTGAKFGRLIELIGHYVYGVTMALQCIALAQYGMNMVQERNKRVEKAGIKLTKDDTDLASRVARKSEALYTAAELSVKNVVQQRYPGWCRPVFAGEWASIGIVAKSGYWISDCVYDSDYMQRVAHVSRDGSILCCLSKDPPVGQIKIKLLDKYDRQATEIWEIWQVPKSNKPAVKWFTIDYHGFGMHGPPVLFNLYPKGPRDVYCEHWDLRYYERQLVIFEAGSSTNVMASQMWAIAPITWKIGDTNALWHFQ